MDENRLNVLITSFGSNTSIGVAKSLLNFVNVKIVGIDINDYHQCAGSIFCHDFVKSPRFDHPDYNEFILELIEKHEIHCVIPIHDKEIEKIAELSMNFPDRTKWAVNPLEVIFLCNDKYSINQLLSKHIPVPKCFSIEDIFNASVIVKPNDGVSSIGLKVFDKINDDLKSHYKSGDLIQEFIKGSEFTVDCYKSYNTSEFCYSVRERIETKNGMSVKSRIVDIPVLGDYCKKIYEILDFKGVSNIQFIKSGNQFYFIEINPRFAGGGILTYKSGLNMPLYTIQDLTGVRLEEKSKDRTLQFGNQMTRYLEETFYDKSNHIIRP